MVIDTHVLVWTLQADSRLGAQAAARIVATGRSGTVLLPAIAIWEIALLDSRNKVTLGAPAREWFERALALPGLDVVELTPAIALDAAHLPGGFHKDPADRLIVATARQLNLPLVTADRQILRYAAAGHVEAIDARH